MMSLPAALADLGPHPRWVVWRWVERTPGAKPDKPLFRARDPRRHASTQDPASWATFEEAAACVAAKMADGIGYVLRDDGELVFLDLDNCRDPATGDLAPWAVRMVEQADSYTEITPSGRGLRIVGRNESLKASIHRRIAMPDGGSVEVFHRCARYVTVSGDALDGSSGRLRPICDLASDLLVVSTPGGPDADAPPAAEAEPNPDAAGSPEDIAAALASIPNGDLPWDEWSRIGMAAFRASGGSAEALEAWTAWSAKSRKHADGACAERWAHWRRSPPTRLGFGTLYHEARRANPLWVPPSRAMAVPGHSAAQAPWDATPHPAPPAAREAPQAPALALLTADEAIALAPPRWLVRDLIPEGALMVLYGPPGAGKSFLALDIAMRLAHGMAWRRQPLPRRDVVYLAAEGGGGFGARIEAWSRHNAMDGSDSGFRLLRATVDLLNTEGVAAFAATLRAACDAAGLRPALFVLDTLARCMAGGDENEARDMGAAIRGVGAIQEALDGAAALVVHHPGKDKDRGPRGSYALVGAADAIALVERVGEDGIRLTVEKQKDAEDGQRMEFRRIQVPLPTRSLEARSSLAVEPRDEAPAEEPMSVPARLSNAGRIAHDLLLRAISKDGEPSPGSEHIPEGIAVVHVEAWRREFYEGCALPDAESKRRTFNRVRQELLAKRMVAAYGVHVWPTGRERR